VAHEGAHQTRLGLVTGLVLTEKAASFERVLFRATRGNMFLKLAHIDGLVKDPALGTKVRARVTRVTGSVRRTYTRSRLLLPSHRGWSESRGENRVRVRGEAPAYCSHHIVVGASRVERVACG
jgi:hypothetical protein